MEPVGTFMEPVGTFMDPLFYILVLSLSLKRQNCDGGGEAREGKSSKNKARMSVSYRRLWPY